MTKNNWYVITGAPSSGKTTTLKTLEKKGYKVYHELARIYIDQELKRGRTLSQIRENEKKFQDKVLQLKINFEKKLDPKKMLFMDRGIPDTTAYYKLIGFKKNAFIKNALNNCSYKQVFLLELIKYSTDYARTESQEQAIILDQLLEEAYREIGSEIVRVPKMSVEKRVSFILKNL